jgi:5-formyltetrahydrofolate cyclo-ligase
MEGEKDRIRARIKEQRHALGQQERKNIAESIKREILCMKEFRECRLFFTYISHDMEIPTMGIMRAAFDSGKIVAAPKVVGEGKMEFYALESIDFLSPGAFGILEPQGKRVLTPKTGQTFLLLPGLAFTRRGDRLGYGGGYYDRYLEAHQGIFLAAPAYPFSVIDYLPVQVHDIRAHALVLPGEVIYTK